MLGRCEEKLISTFRNDLNWVAFNLKSQSFLYSNILEFVANKMDGTRNILTGRVKQIDLNKAFGRRPSSALQLRQFFTFFLTRIDEGALASIFAITHFNSLIRNYFQKSVRGTTGNLMAQGYLHEHWGWFLVCGQPTINYGFPSFPWEFASRYES